MYQQPIKLNQSRDFSDTINAVFSFVGTHFKPLTSLFFTYAMIPVLLTGVLATFYNQESIANAFKMIAGQQVVQADPNWMMMTMYLTIAIIAQTFIAGLVYEYLVIYNQNNNETPSLPQVWSRFLKDLPAFLGFFFLTMISIIFIAAFAAIFIGLSATISKVLAVILGIGLMLGLFYIAVPLSLMLMVKANEDKGFAQSWSRCFKLVKDNWWVTFLLLLVMALIQALMGMAFTLPQMIFYGIQGITTVTSGQFAESNQTLAILFSVIATTGASWLNTLINLTIGIHYFSLAEQKDNSSLINSIDNISTSETEL